MNPAIRASLLVLASALLVQGTPLAAAPAAELRGPELLAFLNDRLSHSTFTRIEPDGRITLRSSSKTYRFNIKDVSFNLNAQNDDARLRVVSDPGAPLDEKGDDDDRFRQSFLCHSTRAARESVEALRKLKRTHTDADERFKHLRAKLDPKDPDLKFTTLGEAVDFVNDCLGISVLTGVDPQGRLFINGSDSTYRVDLKRSEFAFNSRSDDPKVRVYGEWSLGTLRHGRLDREITRESFTAVSRQAAYQAIKALYFIKGAFTGLDATQIGALRNVTRKAASDYTTIQGAVDAINDRLAISIILGIDAKGVATINASENIYRVNLGTCWFEKARPNRRTFEGWVKRTFHIGEEEGVTISSKDGLQRCTSPDSCRSVDEETFSCESSSDTREVLRALEFIQGKVRGQKG